METFHFQIGDIVKLAHPEKFYNSFIFQDNLFTLTQIDPDRVHLSVLSVETVPAEEIRPVKIDGVEDRSIYFDPIIAASTLAPGDPAPVHYRDYTYYLDAMAKVKLENSDTTLFDIIRKQGCQYVHEVQCALRSFSPHDKLRIHHTLK